jgi:osmotically-inducible protein OsmY
MRFILICAATTLLAGVAAASMSDAWITTKVKMSLIGSSETGGMPINVDTNQGRVTLSGKVQSSHEKAAAERIARQSNGVMSVRNLLQVVPKGEMRKETNRSDDQIKDAVNEALDHEQALENSSIKVKSVNKGVVLLTGKAASLSDHLRAMEVARDVPGTVRVASEIKSPNDYNDREIWGDNDHDNDHDSDRNNYDRNTDHTYSSNADKDHDKNVEKHEDKDANRSAMEQNEHKDQGNRFTDGWITARTKMDFMTDSQVPAGDINVDTRRGVVTLFGTVPNQEAKNRAKEIAAKISGVHDVKDELTVLGHEKTKQDKHTDSEIESAVKQRLSNAKLRGADVNVDVKGQAVRLTGTVSSYRDAHEAVALAYHTRGVKRVMNEIHLDEKAAASR